MASLFIEKSRQFEKTDGTPAASYYLHFLEVGTLTPKNTYPSEADAIAGTNANSNPIQLNASGRSANAVWITGRYRFIYSDNATPGSGTTIDEALIEDSVPSSDFQDGTPVWAGTAGGSAAAITATYTPTVVLSDGMTLGFRAASNCPSGGVTFNPDATGAKSIVLANGTNPPPLAWRANDIVTVRYNSTQNRYELQSPTAAMVIGTHTIPIWASAMFSRTTNGAAPGLVELVTNDVMLASKDFDQTTSEGVQFYVPMPKSWNEGTITAQFGWTAASGSGTVTWAVAATAFSDDDALDTAFGTAQSVTDTFITANDMHITSATPAVTVGGTPAESDFVIFQITRDVADTLNADAKLIWCKVFITYDAGNDA